ncbi:hypothetical protein ACHQM5_013720 [Ranunculus cassubicifolius]
MSPSTSRVHKSGATSIATLHSDIIHTHILTRLDGPSLASISCSSSHHPRMLKLISDFPNGHCSFYCDSFPSLVSHPDLLSSQNFPSPIELVSAVDIRYKDKLIFSKVEETKTHSRLFRCSSFCIDLLEPKNAVPTSIEIKDDTCQTLMEDLSLTWVLVIGKKAANLSSFKPVSVHRHWLTNDIWVKFATILRDHEVEMQCKITLTFERKMEVCGLSFQLEDMDGNNVNGETSLRMLQKAVEGGERRKVTIAQGRERYEEYMAKIAKSHQIEGSLFTLWECLAIIVKKCSLS